MSSTIYGRLVPWGVTIASTAIATLLSLWLYPLLARTIGAFFYIAVIVTTSYADFRLGIVTIVLSTLAISYLFIPPIYQFTTSDPADLMRLGVFALVAFVLNLLNSDLRRSKNTIQHLSQQLIQESSDRLRMALAAAQMGLWDWNIVTGEIIWSPEHEQLFGFALGTFDGRYETFDACLHPDDRPGIGPVIQQALQNHTVYQHEYRVIWPDGSIHWVEGRGQAFYNESGQAVRMSGTITNIDHRKQSELALKRSEQQLRAIFNAEPECVKIITADGALQNMNPAGLAMIEAENLEQIHGQNICPLIAPAHQQAFLEFTQHVANGKPGILEFEIIGLKGTRRWLESHAVPLYLQDEATTQVLGVTRDITEYKQTEAELQALNAELEQRVAERTFELQQSNTLLTSFFNAASSAEIGLCIHDKDWRFLQINEALAAINGLPVELHIGRTVAEILPQLAPTVEPLFRQVLETKQPILNLEIADELPSRPGITRHWLASYFPILDGTDQIKAIGVIVVEITDRKRAESALSRLAAIVESSEDAIISKNLDGIITSWNASAERLFGYSAAAAIGQPIYLVIPPEQHHEEDQILFQIRQGVPIRPYETVRQRKDGTLVDVSISISLVKDATGKIIGASKIARDITQRRTIDRMKTEFISIVSHELRTPLTAIRGSLGLLAAGVYDKKPEKGKRMLQVAAQQSDRLVRLVNDILDLQRLESGRMKLAMQVYDATALIQQSVDILRPGAEQNQIQFVVTSLPAHVWANPDAIVQTLTNLLSNAIKFSEPGSKIWISVKLARKKEKEERSKEGQENSSALSSQLSALFTITDQGRGIPTDKLEAIFERFQQVDASDSREKGGTGLGLAICRKIIEQHGGRIWAESVVGKGSTFYFTLPLPPNEG
jgi:PAS domain S-box-containing protein